jgi:cell division protein FtsB
MNQQWLQQRAIQLALGVLFLFALYSNILVFVRNRSLNDRLATVHEEVAQVEARNYRLKLLLAYYQTQSYQETEARRRLGLKKADEVALIIKGTKIEDTNDQLANQDLFETAKPLTAAEQTNFNRWWQYFFGKK